MHFPQKSVLSDYNVPKRASRPLPAGKRRFNNDASCCSWKGGYFLCPMALWEVRARPPAE